MFEGYRQHDCQECLRYLISHLNETQLSILTPTPALALEPAKRPARVIRNPGPAVPLPTASSTRFEVDEPPASPSISDEAVHSDTSNELVAFRLGDKSQAPFIGPTQRHLSMSGYSSPDDRSTKAIRSNSAQLTPTDDQPFPVSSPAPFAGSPYLPEMETQEETASPMGSDGPAIDMSEPDSGPILNPSRANPLSDVGPQVPVPRPCEALPGAAKSDVKLPTLTYVDALFQGQLLYTTRCMCCENETTRSEGFHDLSLPVPERPTCLPACLDDAYKGVEVLSGNNKFFCGQCHAHTEASRSVRLEHLPPVLTIHLNRSSNLGLGKVCIPRYALDPTHVLTLHRM